MGRLGAVFVAGLVAVGVPAVAQEAARPALTAIGIAEICLQVGDAAFEHALRDDVTEADQALLAETYGAATFECLGLAMEVCEGQDEGTACLGDLALWVREHRAGIEAGLGVGPAEVDPATCDHMDEAQRARYCETVSEGVALDEAYQAWRLARRTGEVARVGHAPIDLEMLR